MDKNQVNTAEDLNKSIDSLVNDLFAEPIIKGEAINIAGDSKTTADAALASVPGSENDNSNPGRPKQMHTVSDGGDSKYDAKVVSALSEQENEEAKKQSKDISQLSSEGRIGKSFQDDPEYKEYQALKKAEDQRKQEVEAKIKAEELKKSEDLKKVEQTDLIKKAVNEAISGIQKENELIKKAFNEQTALMKSILGQPVQSKSVTSIDALEKSLDSSAQSEQTEFSKAEKLDAAENLVKSGKLPIDAVIELENTGTVYNQQWQELIGKELQKN